MKAMSKVAPMLNGVDVTKLGETITAIKETPALAKFTFFNDNRWLSGGHNRSTIGKFYGALETHRHTTAFTLDSDEAPLLLGNDLAANPGEYLLHALAACITTTMVYHASARGMVIDELETSLEGGADLQGFLGLREDVRPGFEEIRVSIRIKGDLTDDQIQEIGGLARRFSAVYDMLSNGTRIDMTTERK